MVEDALEIGGGQIKIILWVLASSFPGGLGLDLATASGPSFKPEVRRDWHSDFLLCGTWCLALPLECASDWNQVLIFH